MHSISIFFVFCRDEKLSTFTTPLQGCGSATRFRDCTTKKKIIKTCSQQPLNWSRVGPSLAPVYNLAKHKSFALPITRNVRPTLLI